VSIRVLVSKPARKRTQSTSHRSQRSCQRTSSAKYNRQCTKWPLPELRQFADAELLTLACALKLPQRPGTTTTRRSEVRLTQFDRERGAVFAGVSVPDNCFGTRLLSYRKLGYVTCRHFRRVLVMQTEQFHQPSLFWRRFIDA
jgi:hypothetical protein